MLEEEESPNLFTLQSIESAYWEIETIQYSLKPNVQYRLNVIHLNIHSILDKQDKMKLLLSKLNEHNINIDCVLLCETYLTDNIQLVNIPGYTYVYKKGKQ